jgi:hypothetical protein
LGLGTFEVGGSKLFLEDAEEEPEPEPSTESAGGIKPPGRIGSGLDGNGEPNHWRSVPIEDLGLSMRAYTYFRSSGLITLGDILARTEDEILAQLGRPSADQFVRVLLKLEIRRKKTHDVPLRPKNPLKGARKAFRELRERLDELELVPIDADWDTARHVN